MNLKDLDHPLIFALAMTLIIASLMYVIGWGLTAVGATGPAKLFTYRAAA